jgi:hypothetical protein
VRSRLLFAGLSVALAAVTIRSILVAPSVSRMQAVPAHACLVYNNESPGWFLSFFPMFGTAGGEFSNGWKTDGAGMQKVFQTLEARPLTVATVAFGGRERRDTWVAVSELGGPAALALRWRLMLFPPAGIAPVRPYAVWPVWRFEHPSLPGWAQVRFSVTEGLLICAVSTDSHDIHRLLDTIDGRAVSRADSAVK